MKRISSYCKQLVILALLGGNSVTHAWSQNQNPVNQENRKIETNKQSLNTTITNANENNFQPVPGNIAEPSRAANGPKFYETQSVNYRGYLDFSPKDATAWENYYKSTRYSNYSKTSNNITPEEQKELDGIVKEMEKNVPGTYEFHFVTYLNGNNDVQLFPHLQKAYELNPKSTELLDEFIIYYELTGNPDKKTEFSKKLYNSNEISKDMMEFNYNLLNSIEQKAILFTHGEMDTYPSWILQDIKNTRTDIEIVYIELLEKEDYRKSKLKELGVTVNADFNSSRSQFLKEFAQKSNLRPVYFATTVAPELLKPFQSNLYLTGLAFKYSETEFDNLSMLSDNWENKFKRDALLKKNYQGTIQSKLNLNYIPGLLLLNEYYKKVKFEDKAKLAEDMAVKLGSEGGKEQQVKACLKK